MSKTSTSRPTRVSDFLTHVDARPPLESAQDHFGEELALWSFKDAEGPLGKFVICDVSLAADDAEHFNLSIGSRVACEQLHAIKRNAEFPLLFTLVKAGKGYHIE